jgi:hypothetical protein
MFGKKSTKLNSDEYEQLYKKIVACVGDIDELKAAVQILKTNNNSLRGLMNRKFQIENEDTEKDKYGGLLPM